jgi:hypothetical protein
MTREGRWTKEQVEQVHEILKYSTKDKPVTSDVIRQVLGIKDFSGRWKSRDLITEMMRRTGLPLAASNEGYFVMNTLDDLKVYRSQLRERMLKIQNRIDLVEKNWEKKHGSLPDDEDSEDEDAND